MQVLSLDTQSGLLLIPVSMVAQITSRTEESSLAHDLTFIRSSIRWREYQIPLLFSSEVLGANQGADDAYLRSVALWPMKGSKITDLFALSSLDSPRVVSIESEVSSAPIEIHDEFNEHGDSSFVLGIIELGEKLGIIPDLKSLSEEVFS